MASRRSSSASRYLVRQTCAQPMKKRWSPVRPSRTGASAPSSDERIRLVGDRQAAEVADVLADGQRTVDVLAGKLLRLEPVVLGDQLRGAGLELLAVGLGPPVVHVAVAVVLRSLVVEAVADLVADHGADAAVVHRVVGLHVEERRLKDRGGEDDLVHPRVVVGVDRLRRHEPFVAIDRLAQLGELAIDLEGGRALDVADEVVAV